MRHTDMAAAVRYRPMTVTDVPVVYELERALFPLDAWSEQLFIDEVSQAHTGYFVAVLEGKTIGYAGLSTAGSSADIQTVAVAPRFQGRGVGRALMGQVLGSAQAQNVREVFLEVRADNGRAQELYRRLGFEPFGCRARYYRDGVDAVLMRKHLPASVSATDGGTV